MTTNERSYIKNFGRVANTARQSQTDQIHDGDEVIGSIETNWSQLGYCWIFKGISTNGDLVSSLDHETFEDAQQWIRSQSKYNHRHDSFGAYITYILDDLQLSKTQLGHMLGVSRQTIHDWINNKYLPDVPHFVMLARKISNMTSSNVNLILLDMSDSIV